MARIPEAEAPEGKWCFAYVKAAQPQNEYWKKSGRFRSFEGKKQAVKINGNWWMLSDTNIALEPFECSCGYIMGDNGYPIDTIKDFVVDTVVVIPEHLLPPVDRIIKQKAEPYG